MILMFFDKLMPAPLIRLNCSMKKNWEIEDSLDLRLDMVAEQLISRGINNPDILDAFREVPRHPFVPHVSVYEAYSDQPLPIKSGQTISQPFIVAQMLTYLDPQPQHHILEIGSGSGYATALLARLCTHVEGMDVYRDLLDDSKVVLDMMNINNVHLNHRSAWEQFESQEVYQRIILWASPPRIPEHLFDKLDEKGILVAPEGKSAQYVWVFKNENGNLIRERKDAVRFVPLVQGSAQQIDRN